jgi:hypothetical protein
VEPSSRAGKECNLNSSGEMQRTEAPRTGERGMRISLPSPAKAAYLGGLAALVALELIEWPIAMAIGVGGALISAGRGKRTLQATRDSSS